MEIVRLHCLGNEYLAAGTEAHQFSLSALALALCQTWYGQGCSGLLVLSPGPPGQTRLDLLSSRGDRTLPGTSAIRCAGYFLGNGSWEMDTGWGPQRVTVWNNLTDLWFPPPLIAGEYQIGRDFYGQIVSLRQKYFVTSVHKLGELKLEAHGQAVSRYFGGISSVFFQDFKNVEARIWQEGRGEAASGSGACAAAAVLRQLGRWREPMTIEMPGGSVEITIDRQNWFVQKAAVSFVSSIPADVLEEITAY